MRTLLKRLGMALFGLVVVLLVYGVAVEPRLILDERRYTVESPGLAHDTNGTELAVFSDLQVGMWLANLGMIEKVVERAAALEPDAVLILGDFVYGRSPRVEEQTDQAIDLLRPLLDREWPVLAVLGNHDHDAGAAQLLERRLTQEGVSVLRNASVPLTDSEGSEALRVVGIDAYLPGFSDPERAFEDVPSQAPRVVMMHNPDSYPPIPAHQAPLAMAGHTHCGQISLPVTPHWSYLQLTHDQPTATDGWAEDSFGATGNRLFVNCGIGFSDLPLRIFSAPQLVVFELSSPEL